MAKKTVEAEESSELIVVKEQTALEAFNDDDALEKMFTDIKAAFDNRFPTELDMKIKKDRDALRSAAAKIPKVKTRIDEFRKSSTESMRLQIAGINKRGMDIVARLDEYYKEKRKPLTDWENAETERQNEIKDQIQSTREIGQISFGETSEQIQARIEKMPTHDLEWYAEFKDEAEIVIEETFARLVQAKTIAINAEKDAAERAAERAELDRLREESERNEREREARELIGNIRNAGNCVLYLDGDFLDTQQIMDWLLKLRIDSRFGDLVDEANDIREASMAKLQKKLEAEKAEAAADAARKQAIADQEAALETQRLELQAESDRKIEEDRQRIVDAARAELEAEQKVETDRIEAERVETERKLKEQFAADREASIKEALEDINRALEGTKRATAAQSVLDAVIGGAVRHVIAPALVESVND